MKNEPYFMHGIDVAYSSVYTQKLREKLLEIEIPCECIIHSKDEWEKEIHRVYLGAGAGVIKLQNKIKIYDKQSVDICKEKWEEIKAVLRETPSTDEMNAYLASVNLDISEFEKMYGKEKIKDAVLYAKDLKDRYTILWLYNLLKRTL